mmetsp:Transcript_42365/g.106792  ORF Transcript_42365/g.106792 Transcript_42365/m.106792 type:complete len:125 (-) Transcript_42365:86-460(-)
MDRDSATSVDLTEDPHESDIPTQEVDYEKLHANLTDMALVCSTWNIEETKFTEVLCRDVQTFKENIAMVISIVESVMSTPEATPSDSIIESYAEIVDKYDTLNEIAKTNQTEKRRRLTPENSLE